jgi:hypothetical protein
MLHTMRIFLCTLAMAAAAAWPQGTPDFSGTWKQDNDRCQPRRRGDVALRIEQRDHALTVETTMTNSSGSSRHAEQKYTTDGKVSVSTGADGDEFHTAVVWKDSSLIFTIEEHEDGRILRSKETWTLIENGAALQRVREPLDKGEKQTLIYTRQQPSRFGNPAGAGALRAIATDAHRGVANLFPMLAFAFGAEEKP